MKKKLFFFLTFLLFCKLLNQIQQYSLQRGVGYLYLPQCWAEEMFNRSMTAPQAPSVEQQRERVSGFWWASIGRSVNSKLSCLIYI